MIMNKIFGIVLFFVLLSLPASGGKGSVYSRYGIGEINPFLSAKNVGMGNAGIALFGETHINLLNPAAAATINRTIISASYQYHTLFSEDANTSTVLGSGNISSFALAMPVYSPNRIALTLGILPFSSVSYEQSSAGSIDGNPYTHTFEGRGGISSAQIGLSYGVSSELVLGATMHYLFGSIYRDQSTTFASSDFFGGSFQQTFSLSGYAMTFGVVYTGAGAVIGLPAEDRLNVGATVFTGSSLNYDEEILRNFSVTQDTTRINTKTIDLPFGFSAGLGYTKNKTVYAADIHFQNWGSFAMDGVTNPNLQNSIRVSGGVEFLPVSDFVSDDFWRRVSYRFGGYLRRSHLNISGNSIDELFGSAGISLPFSFESRIHLGLEYGIRGTTASNLIKDSIVRFTLSLTASELMFIQPPID